MNTAKEAVEQLEVELNSYALACVAANENISKEELHQQIYKQILPECGEELKIEDFDPLIHKVIFNIFKNK